MSRSANSSALSGWLSSSVNCSGVVIRMSGGARPLPRPPRHRRIAGARLGADRQLHLGDRRHEVARDVDGQRLQRRDIESVQAAAAVGAPALRKADEARQEAGQRLAGAGRGDEQGRAALLRRLDQRQLMRPRGPAPRGEPAGERLGQRRGDGRRRLQARRRAWRPRLVSWFSSVGYATLRCRNGWATMLRADGPCHDGLRWGGTSPPATDPKENEHDGPQHLPWAAAS